MVSHEMRTPLHAVLAIASVLQHSKSLLGEDQEMVNTISTSAGLLSVLINDVLDVSRINHGDFHLRTAPFDLRNLIREASRMVEPMAKESGYKFTVEVSELPQYVDGDAKRTMQMCLNLLNHALKFTKSKILFRVWEEDSLPHSATHRIRVDVIDDGVGIEASLIGSLCERFHQLDPGRKAGGMGLGLSICRHLARLMGGAVWLESPGAGKGTTASFCINLKRISQDVERTIIRRSESVGSLKGMRVLVVDDNSVNRLVTAKMLRKLGCLPKTVESGEACLRLLEAEATSVTFCFMDLTMPGWDGFTTMEKIAALPESKKPQTVVALTADQRPATLDRCLAAGMAGVLVEPANLDSLRDTLLEHMISG